MRTTKATVVSVGHFYEPGAHPLARGNNPRARMARIHPALEGWHMTGGDWPVDPTSDRPIGGYHLDELRELAQAAGTYHPAPEPIPYPMTRFDAASYPLLRRYGFSRVHLGGPFVPFTWVHFAIGGPGRVASVPTIARCGVELRGTVILMADDTPSTAVSCPSCLRIRRRLEEAIPPDLEDLDPGPTAGPGPCSCPCHAVMVPGLLPCPQCSSREIR